MCDLELEVVQTLEGHTDRVWCVAWNHAGTLLASCGTDKTVRIWKQEGCYILLYFYDLACKLAMMLLS